MSIGKTWRTLQTCLEWYREARLDEKHIQSKLSSVVSESSRKSSFGKYKYRTKSTFLVFTPECVEHWQSDSQLICTLLPRVDWLTSVKLAIVAYIQMIRKWRNERDGNCNGLLWKKKQKKNNLSLCMKLCFAYVPSIECRFIVSEQRKIYSCVMNCVCDVWINNAYSVLYFVSVSIHLSITRL